MRKLCIGVNGYMDEIKRLAENISSIGYMYTSDFFRNTTGGRKGGVITNIDQLREISNYLKTKDIEYWITNNQTVLGHKRVDKEFWAIYKDHIQELEDIGVKGMVVGHPFIIDFIKRNTKLDVCVSTTAEVTNARAAVYYEELGADMVCPSYSINYDIKKLEGIKSSLKYAKVKILVNEFCLGDCIYRRSHQNSYFGDLNLDTDYGFTCHKIVMSKPETILQNNAIRPEDLKYYNDIVDIFKISLRHPPFSNYEQSFEIAQAYANGCYDGNYMELLTQRLGHIVKIPNSKLNNLHSIKIQCDKNCTVCDTCKKIYDDAVSALEVG